MDTYGYILLHRSIFFHHLFRAEPFSWREAWICLIAEAAWCPCQRRVGYDLVTLERGQLATSIRQLAAMWGWHRASVERFLDKLEVEAMIRRHVPATPSETATETPRKGQLTVITICNYSEFQKPPTGQNSQARQYPRRREQQGIDVEAKVVPQESNKQTNRSRGAGDRKRDIRGRVKPRHGQQSKKHGTIWFDWGTDEYLAYAEDYRNSTGAEPLPQSYIGGKGRWFNYSGEPRSGLVRCASDAVSTTVERAGGPQKK